MVDPTHNSGLGRTFDFSLTSNRIGVAGFGVAAAVLTISSTVRDDLTLFGALAAAIAVFLGWAVGRELDPQLPGAATVAMILSLVFALFSVPGAVATGVSMIALRVVAGTVGTRIGWGDVAMIGLIGLAAGLKPTLAVPALAIAVWLWVAPEVGRRNRVALAILGAGIAVGVAWVLFASDGYPAVEITSTAYVLAAIAGGAMMLSARPAAITVLNDAGTQTVLTQRVRLARIVAGSACMWAAVWGGVGGFWELGPVFAGLIGAAIYRVFVHPA